MYVCIYILIRIIVLLYMSFFYYFVLYDKAVDVYIHTRNDSVQIELLDLEITFESSYLVEMISRAIRF